MAMKPRLFKNRAAWRAWLELNHDNQKVLWLAYYKKNSGKTSVTYEEALEEALCFGWIDSTVNRLDDERYMQKWTPRNEKSIWSASNKARVKKLTAEGRLAAPGLAKVKTAKRNGSWRALDLVDPKPEIPPDLAAAVEADPLAKANFGSISNSQKKMLIWWIIGAKRPETRARRIARGLEMIRTGEKFGINWRAGRTNG